MDHNIRYNVILDSVESFVKNALAVQVTDESDPCYGGFRCPDHLICEPWSAARVFTTMSTLLCNPISQHYRSSSFFQRMKLALDFISASQNDDGTINTYFSGEIRSASNLPFLLAYLMKAYKLLLRENFSNRNILEPFIERAARALKSIPLSSPIQRLAAASVLIDFDKIFIDHASLTKAEDYLSDGIDINHDGLYGDKSIDNNMTLNSILLNVAKKTGRSYMIEYVRRNLNFNLYNFCLSGEFSVIPSLRNNMPQGYSVWKEMSIIDHNGYYASAGDESLSIFLTRMQDGYCKNHAGTRMSEGMYSRLFFTSSIGELLLAEDEFNNDRISRIPLPSHYEKVFQNSNIVRFRNGKIGATIIGNNSIIFAINNGQAIVDGFSIKYLYNGYRDFIPGNLELTRKSYILRDEVKGDFTLSISNEFTYKGNGLDLDICATGHESIPIQLEFKVRRQGTVFTGGKEYDLCSTELIFIDKEAIIRSGEDCMAIRGGVIQHRIYSTDDKWAKTNTSLIIAPLTPFHIKIEITGMSHSEPFSHRNLALTS